MSIRGGGSGSIANAYGATGTNGTSLQGAGGTGFMMLHPQQNDMFGTSDAICKFILEGHDRGVNWAGQFEGSGDNLEGSGVIIRAV